MSSFIIGVFNSYLYFEDPAADLSQEYFIPGYAKCSCQQTTGYRKQTVKKKVNDELSFKRKGGVRPCTSQK